ncbi:MAG: SDR family oxidoreductase [Planctomycetes bacterium]|nr:SDR family oxidoreductase [Planctomycetota bacterium]
MNHSRNLPRGLEGRTALITGAAQGLGLGIAESLSRSGAAVILADLQRQKAEEAARTLSAQALEINIADSASVDRCFEKAMGLQGRLDIVVNNAGVGQNVAPTVSLTDQEWQRVMDVTLTGTFYCCRAAARIMEKQGEGTIVNIASINAQNPAALVAAYNVAKAGVLSLTRTLALELAAYGVRVNAVCPGPVYTEFNKTVMAQRCQTLGITEEQMIERIRSSIPMGRWGEARDIANAVVFLCSPQSAWITGEVLRVSGGLEGVSAAPPKRTTS